MMLIAKDEIRMEITSTAQRSLSLVIIKHIWTRKWRVDSLPLRLCKFTDMFFFENAILN